MKYEIIFGDEKLFDGAPEECFCVARNAYGDRIFYKAECGALFWLYNGEWKPLQVMSCTPLAMRRIIKEPKRWTWEDKKAGVLPDVGSIFTYRDETLTCHFIDGDGEIWAHDIDNNIVTPLLRDCQPIKTKEERAQRLREEWCSNALDSASILSGMREYELKRLGGYIGNIYDALLSGDLPVPVKDAKK